MDATGSMDLKWTNGLERAIAFERSNGLEKHDLNSMGWINQKGLMDLKRSNGHGMN